MYIVSFGLFQRGVGGLGGAAFLEKYSKCYAPHVELLGVVCPPESLLTASSGGEWAGSVPLFWNGVMCRRADIESCCSQLASRTQIGSPQAEYWSPLAHRHRQHPSHWNHLPIGRKPRIWQIDCEKRFQKCLTVEKKGNFWPQCFFFLRRPCVHGHLHYFWNEARPFTFRIYIYIYIYLLYFILGCLYGLCYGYLNGFTNGYIHGYLRFTWIYISVIHGYILLIQYCSGWIWMIYNIHRRKNLVLGRERKGSKKCISVRLKYRNAKIATGFRIFFIFNPAWGNDQIWLIFFKWVEITN